MKSRPFRAVLVFVTAVALTVSALAGTATEVRADTYQQVVVGLSTHDVYISNDLFGQHKATTSDLNKLQGAVYTAAQSQGVTEKIALVSGYPPRFHSSPEAASALTNFLDIQGVLILVSPRGVGIGSAGDLTDAEMTAIARRTQPRCVTSGFVACAVYASQQAAVQAKSDRNAAFRSAAVFWAVLIILLGLVIFGVILFNSRRKRAATGGVPELRVAASQTVLQADSAVTDIETAGATMPEDVRAQYERALHMRNRARHVIDRSSSPAALRQANEDAAQAMLALQGVMKRLQLKNGRANPLELGAQRCFYCSREDRPPYVTRPIDDGKGSSMNVHICTVCTQQLQEGKTPQLTTGTYGGVLVPWWAVPESPWYYVYGGSAWQYWLPFMVGMDVEGWFNGPGSYTGSHGDRPAQEGAVAASSDASQVPSDA